MDNNEQFNNALADAVIVTGEGIKNIAKKYNRTKEETLEMFIEGLRLNAELNARLDIVDDLFLSWLEKEGLI